MSRENDPMRQKNSLANGPSELPPMEAKAAWSGVLWSNGFFIFCLKNKPVVSENGRVFFGKARIFLRQKGCNLKVCVVYYL